MRVLVTGAGGQVGRELVRLGPALGVEVVGLDRAALDVTDAAAVRAAVEAARPEAVVNAAAYTAVDRAEAEPETAFEVNRHGARHVAEAAEAVGIPVVQISTDYVFDGSKETPYAAGDATSPVNVYGASKAAGEIAVRGVSSQAIVLRTAWVFSSYGRNFITTMLRLAAERPRLGVVADQWGHPTAAADVARAALAAAARARGGLRGTFHVAGLPLTTWHGLADAALALQSEMAAVPKTPVDPIRTEDYPTAARRPQHVALELGPSFAALGLDPFHWPGTLRVVVGEILNDAPQT